MRPHSALFLIGALAATASCAKREKTSDSTTCVAASGLEVVLGARANAPFSVREPRSRVGASVKLQGASDAARVDVAGTTRFPKGFSGRFDVEQRVTELGVEDFVHFDAAPAKNELAYDVTLADGVAGLRLVGSVLELLDEKGVPRVRMNPPWIERDADHHRDDVAVAVRGCAVDVDPRVPWDRPVLSPGARTCTVVLSWSTTMTYPATLDPAWTTTASSMATPRAVHTSTTLANGDVLLTGGCDGTTTVGKTAEIFGAGTKVFTATASMSKTRAYHTATLLLDGRVLVTGGIQNGGNCRDATGNADAEIYSGGTWTSVSMSTSRAWHSATLLLDGKVLVAGGHDGVEGVTRSSSEVFDPSTDTFHTSTGAMASGRYAGGIGTLRDGRALWIGGTASPDALLYDPTTETWTTAPTSGVSSSNRVITLASGKVLSVGGFSAGTRVVEFDPVTNTFTVRAPLTIARWEPAFVALPTGGALVAAGHISSGYTTSVDLLPEPGGTVPHPALAVARTFAAGSLVGTSGDRVLVTGGQAATGPTTSAELSDPGVAAGSTCASDADCDYGHRCVATKCTAWAPDASIVYDAPPSDTSSDASADTVADAGAETEDAPVDSTSDDSTVADTAVADTTVADTTVADTTVADTAVEDTEIPDTASDTGPMAPDAEDPKEKPVITGTPTSCTTSADCASGFCVDHVCCNTACTERCHSCALPQAPGTCMLQPIGYDMRGECEADRPCYSTCGPTGECIPAFAGARCETNKCTGPSTGKGAAVCSGERGVCLRDEAIDFDCAPYACEPALGACHWSCATSAQCAPGNVCDTSTGHCIASPSSEEDSGCAVSMTKPDADSTVPTLIALLCGIVVTRARRWSSRAATPTRGRRPRRGQ